MSADGAPRFESARSCCRCGPGRQQSATDRCSGPLSSRPPGLDAPTPSHPDAFRPGGETRRCRSRATALYSLMQFNSRSSGLAIQAYESRLVSDQTPFDRFLSGRPERDGPAPQQGLGVFTARRDCMECHVARRSASHPPHRPTTTNPANGDRLPQNHSACVSGWCSDAAGSIIRAR